MYQQLKFQVMGVTLAILTSIGCILYEKIVKAYSFSVILILMIFFCASNLLLLFFINGLDPVKTDLSNLLKNDKYLALGYCITWLTAPIWFWITKRQGVLAGGIYEMKYVVVLAIFYSLFGSRPLTWNLILGLIFACISVYLVSK